MLSLLSLLSLLCGKFGTRSATALGNMKVLDRGKRKRVSYNIEYIQMSIKSHLLYMYVYLVLSS